MSDYFLSMTFEQATSKLLPLVFKVVHDSEPVIREAISDQIPAIYQIIQKKGDSGSRYQRKLLRIIITLLLNDSNSLVRVACGNALVKIISLIDPETIKSTVIPTLQALLRTPSVENKTQGLNICKDIAQQFGKEMCVDYIIPCLEVLAKGSYLVRVAVVNCLREYCAVIGPDDAKALLYPIAAGLVNDVTFSVRIAVAQSLAGFAAVLSDQDKEELLFPVLERFFKDPSRWVRVAAFQQLGRFISEFAVGKVPEDIVQRFTEMVQPLPLPTIRKSKIKLDVPEIPKSKYPDNDVLKSCAYNFPAIVLTLGADRWPEVRTVFVILATSPQWNIRMKISHGIHEIANVVGRDVAGNDLVPFFSGFFKDVDEVKNGVIKHCAAFTKVLAPSLRKQVVPLVHDVVQSERDWRVLKELAFQLGKMSALFPPEVTRDLIAPLEFQLFQHKFSCVRLAAAENIIQILIHIRSNDEVFEGFILELCLFARSSLHTERSLFVGACRHIAQVACNDSEDDAAVYEALIRGLDIVIPSLDPLILDKVVSVRIALAGFLVDTVRISERLSAVSNRILTKASLILQTDKSLDVKYFLSQIAD